ncbi:MAG: hypothetical protein R6W73_01025 [Candidatus Saliniplasma sp.]
MSFEKGIQRVVDTCMKVQPDEKVVIVTDEDSMKIGKKIRETVLEKTNHVRFFNLDIYGERPLDRLPERIIKKAEEATATFFIARPVKGELDPVRFPLINAGVVGGRHAHMVGLTEEIAKIGLSMDYERVAEFTDNLCSMAKRTEEIRVKSDNGTDFVSKVGRYKWVSSTGICSRDIKEAGVWLNLPDGEVYTTPTELEGTAVIDGVIGDYFSDMFGLKEIKSKPLKLEIEQKDKPTIVDVESKNKALEEEFERYIGQNPCSKWIGIIGFGTNIFIEEEMGNILIDRKSPNAHLAAGNPIPELTFAGWSCPESGDLLIPECDVWFDDEKVMEDGEYLVTEDS